MKLPTLLLTQDTNELIYHKTIVEFIAIADVKNTCLKHATKQNVAIVSACVGTGAVVGGAALSAIGFTSSGNNCSSMAIIHCKCYYPISGRNWCRSIFGNGCWNCNGSSKWPFRNQEDQLNRSKECLIHRLDFFFLEKTISKISTADNVDKIFFQ